MARAKQRRERQRGSTMVESAIVATVFLLLLAGIIECGRLGFAYNAVSFAAQRSARYASLRGSASGHAVSAADVETVAKAYTGALDNTQVTVTTRWLPDNNPGSSVEVQIAYTFFTVLKPLSASGLVMRSTARHFIVQ